MSDDRDQRPTDAPFGPEEAEQIIAAVQREVSVDCPRCGGPLQMGPPAGPTISQFTVFLIRCPACRRAVFHGKYLRKR